MITAHYCSNQPRLTQSCHKLSPFTPQDKTQTQTKLNKEHYPVPGSRNLILEEAEKRTRKGSDRVVPENVTPKAMHIVTHGKSLLLGHGEGAPREARAGTGTRQTEVEQVVGSPGQQV